MKTHSEFLPQLAAYHDGALPADQRESVASHVRDCPTCQRLLDDWKALDTALKALPEPAAETDGLTAQVLARITPQADPVKTIQTGRTTRIPIRIWASAAAAAVVLVAATLFLREQDQLPEPLEIAELNTPAIEATPDATTQQTQPSAKDLIQPSTRGAEPEHPAGDESTTSTPQELAASQPSSNTLAGQSSSAAASDQSTTGDSGILQSAESSARLAELVVQEGPDPIEVHYRVPDLLDPAIVDVNLRPVFTVAFEGIGYAPTDMFAEAYDPSEATPRRLPPQVAYMVSSMRMEQSVLMSRTSNQVRSPKTQLRLAEISWRLANMTADQDDVRNAIAAQSAAMRTVPSITTQSLARLAHLRSLQQ